MPEKGDGLTFDQESSTFSFTKLLGGNAENWNIPYSESNHKTEIKSLSKNTQCNMSTLIAQTTLRQTEYRMLQRIPNDNKLYPPEVEQKKKGPAIGGTQCIIFRNQMSLPIMKYIQKRNQFKPFLPKSVLQFCCDKVLLMLINKKIYEVSHRA